MKKNATENLLKMNLQLFAEGGPSSSDDGGNEGGDNNTNGNNNSSEGNAGNTDGNNDKGKKLVSVSQDELSRMMAKEKKEGRAAILRELGVNTDDAKTNKDIMEKFRNWQESQKTELDKANEKLGALEAVQKENMMLTAKVKALSLGAKPDALDDLIALATVKVDEEHSIESILEELKSKYPMFYIVSSADDNNNNRNSGTGRAAGAGGSTPGSAENDIVERIRANKEKERENKKNENVYFRN